jgi:hypothetical protein
MMDVGDTETIHIEIDCIGGSISESAGRQGSELARPI